MPTSAPVPSVAISSSLMSGMYLRQSNSMRAPAEASLSWFRPEAIMMSVEAGDRPCLCSCRSLDVTWDMLGPPAVPWRSTLMPYLAFMAASNSSQNSVSPYRPPWSMVSSFSAAAALMSLAMASVRVSAAVGEAASITAASVASRAPAAKYPCRNPLRRARTGRGQPLPMPLVRCFMTRSFPVSRATRRACRHGRYSKLIRGSSVKWMWPAAPAGRMVIW